MKRIAVLLLAMTCLVGLRNASAEELAPLYPGFPPLRESKAYKKFAARTYSEFSKILYMIDRYSDSQISIHYEGQNYTAAFSTTVARWFLSRNYKKQTAKEWIKQWCSKSIFTGSPIYVKLPDEKFILARDVLNAELQDLERVVRENQLRPESLAPIVILTAPPLLPVPALIVPPSVTVSENPPASEIVTSASVSAPPLDEPALEIPAPAESSADEPALNNGIAG